MSERDADLWDRIEYRCVVGSRAYGLDDENSDTDRRGFYLPPADRHWSLHGVPEQLEDKSSDTVYWELEKFIRLALKGNPNVLECLHTPLVEHATPLARELLAMRSAFLSRRVIGTIGGYAEAQFRKVEADVRATGTAKPKHVMHLLRLLISGAVTLRTGDYPVRVADEHRDRLLAVKRGEVAWPEADRWRQELLSDFNAAARSTTLPERPDTARADAFLIRARRAAIDL